MIESTETRWGLSWSWQISLILPLFVERSMVSPTSEDIQTVHTCCETKSTLEAFSSQRKQMACSFLDSSLRKVYQKKAYNDSYFLEMTTSSQFPVLMNSKKKIFSFTLSVIDKYQWYLVRKKVQTRFATFKMKRNTIANCWDPRIQRRRNCPRHLKTLFPPNDRRARSGVFTCLIYFIPWKLTHLQLAKSLRDTSALPNLIKRWSIPGLIHLLTYPRWMPLQLIFVSCDYSSVHIHINSWLT